MYDIRIYFLDSFRREKYLNSISILKCNAGIRIRASGKMCSISKNKQNI